MNRIVQRSLTLAVLTIGPACLGQSTNALTLHTDLPDVGPSLVRALAALAVVLAIFFGGVWLFRNGQRMAWRKNGSPKLAVLESRSLGNRHALHVVGYEGQRMLVASSPGGINLLSQLPSGHEINGSNGSNGATNGVRAAVPTLSFAESLQQLLRRK